MKLTAQKDFLNNSFPTQRVHLYVLFTSDPSTFGSFAWICFFSLDVSDSDSDWLPDSEPESESLLPDWLLLPSLLLPELEPDPEPDADPESSSDRLQWEVSRILHNCQGNKVIGFKKKKKIALASPIKSLS